MVWSFMGPGGPGLQYCSIAGGLGDGSPPAGSSGEALVGSPPEAEDVL